jgi:hypothetical protein
MANYRSVNCKVAAVLLFIVYLPLFVGCHNLHGFRLERSRPFWHSVDSSCWRDCLTGQPPSRRFSDGYHPVPWPNDGCIHQRAERFLELADALSASDDPRSTDYYFQSAVFSWQAIEGCSSVCADHPCWQLYQASVEGLIADAKRFGRFCQSGKLRIHGTDGPMDIPVVGKCLKWPVEQFTEFQIAKEPKHPKLRRYYTAPGLGVPIIAFRQQDHRSQHQPTEQFFPPRLPVAATAVLRPRIAISEQACGESNGEFILEVVNPLEVADVAIGSRRLPMARDFSAPLEYKLGIQPYNPLADFIAPGIETRDDGLRWLEPYQPGKIPVVFVHGLLSDPTTWFDMVNHLRTQAWFNDHFQIWGFSYSTGGPFVTSAYRLRSQSRAALDMIDPDCQDPALNQIVLIGHSMGGLIAKLQVSESDHHLWNSVATRPLDSICASEEVRQRLADRLYFSPQPFIRRVVYIATPHCGSSLASRGIGRCSSLLVRPDEEVQARHQRLIRDNPGVFTGVFQKRVPTSIDLLQPGNRTLQAIHELCVPESVAQHTIFGTGKAIFTLGCSDGVVPVDSARHPHAISEASVASSHTRITKEEETTREVARILKLHLRESRLALQKPQ